MSSFYDATQFHHNGILFSIHPFVGGTRCSGWYGVAEVQLDLRGKSWEEVVCTTLDSAAEQAKAFAANAVVGFEMELDPHKRHLAFKGTIAKLETLFAGCEVAP